MSLAEEIQKKKDKLKANQDGTIVRTKEGLVFRERVDEKGNFVREEIGKQNFFIEGAKDPEGNK